MIEAVAMGTAETLIALTQGHFSTAAKRRLVKHSTSDNDAKFNSRRLRAIENNRMGPNYLSCSLTELNAKPLNGTSHIVSPSIALHRKQNIIRKVPSQTDMWECIRTNYMFLMKDDLVVACERTKEEMHWCDGDLSSVSICSAPKWTCTEFITRFNKLHDSLHQQQAQAQEAKDKSDFLRAKQSQLRSLWDDCQVLKEQAALLEIRYPDMKDDISRRCNILNNKWEALQQAIWPKRQQKQNGVLAELTTKMKHVRRWLREVDNRLKGLKASAQWPMTQILEVYDRQKALQLEIETRGREVTSLLKQVEAPGGVSVDSCKVLYRVVQNLERYWHTVWLQSLENHCLTEQILQQKRNGNLKAKQLTESSDIDLDEGPRTKYRRITQDYTMPFLEESSNMDTKPIMQDTSYQNKRMGEKQLEKSSKSIGTFANTREIGTLCSAAREAHPVSDKCIMVGSTGIAALKAKYGDDFSNFEIIQDVGYSSESSTHLSSDDVTEYIRVYSYSPPRRASVEDLMTGSDRTMMAESAVPAAQRMFGHSSLGSSSSHNDSGFGVSENTLCEIPVEPEDSSPTNEWNASQEIGSEVSDGSLEEVLGFHLSFSEINDNSPMSVGFTLDGFDSDGSSDFHNRSSFTSDAQAFYKVTSIDSETGDLDSPEKESTNENNSLGFLNSSSADVNASVPSDNDAQDDSVAIPLKLHANDDDNDGNHNYVDNLSLSFREAFKNSHPEYCDWDSDVSDNFFMDLDPRKNLTSSPLRSFRHHLRHQSPSNSHHQLREFPSRHVRCRPAKLDRTSIEKACGFKTTRSKRVREWLCYSNRIQDPNFQVSRLLEDDSPNRDYYEDRYIPSMDARIDSSCDASGEYTTTTESDGDGSVVSSSEDCFEAVPGKLMVNSMSSVESVIPLECDVYGKEVPHLLLPPPPPETPPFLSKRSCDPLILNGGSVTESDADEPRRSTLRATSDGHLNLTSLSFSKTIETGSSTTVNETSNFSCRSDLSLKLLTKSEGTSSESSTPVNKIFGQRFTRSLPSVLHQDSFQSSTSDNCHSYPSEFTRTHKNSQETSKTNKTNKGNRHRKPSSSSNRSYRSGRRRRQTVSDCSTRKRHWSAVQTPLQVRIAKAENNRAEDVQISPDFDRTVVASPEGEFVFTNVEEQSTVSDQVWDGYQEMPYLSEAYSEPTVDEDAIRQLTEFGDDYGSAIGQSSLKGVVCKGNTLPGNPNVKDGLKIPLKEPESITDRHDSDSDLEDLYDILEDTYKALNFAKGTYAYKKNLCNSDFAELIATCQTHLRCLKAILKHIQADGQQENFTHNNVQLHILIKEWEALQENLNMSKKLHSIQTDIDDLRKKIFKFSIEDENTFVNFSRPEDLQKRIDLMEKEYTALMAIKEGELQSVNFHVHELAAEDDSMAHLRSEIINLYRLFQETSSQHANRQVELSKLLERWRNYMQMCHNISVEIGEREESQKQDVEMEKSSKKFLSVILNLRKEADFFARKLSGSELGKAAQKEVATLENRLQKVATPKETKLLFEDGIFDEAESTSRSVCHPDLSSSTVEKGDQKFDDVGDVPTDAEEKIVPKPEKKTPPSKLWRAFRATLPIQLAVVLLYCLACAFEPSCCDLINNFNFSFTPQLRYIRGPPPV